MLLLLLHVICRFLKMSRQLMMLILVTCFVMEAVFSAPAASHQLVPDGLSLFMTPNDMDKLSKGEPFDY